MIKKTFLIAAMLICTITISAEENEITGGGGFSISGGALVNFMDTENDYFAHGTVTGHGYAVIDMFKIGSFGSYLFGQISLGEGGLEFGIRTKLTNNFDSGLDITLKTGAGGLSIDGNNYAHICEGLNIAYVFYPIRNIGISLFGELMYRGNVTGAAFQEFSSLDTSFGLKLDFGSF